MHLTKRNLLDYWENAYEILQGSSYNKPLSPIEFAKEIGVNLYPGWSDITRIFYDSQESYKELIAACGMKSGKTYMAGFFSCHELYLLSCLDNPAKKLGLDADSWIYGICADRNLPQARDGVFTEFLAKAKRCHFFNKLNMDHTTTSYRISDKNLAFVAGPSNSDALVSHTLAWAVLDEMSRIKTTSGERGAKAVYEAASHQLELLDGRLYVISSPLYKQDWTMQLLDMADHNARMFGVQEPTWVMNPLKPRDHPKIVDAFAKNPEAAMRDYGAEPSLALEPFFREPLRIDLCVDPDMRHPLDAHGIIYDWFTPRYNTLYAVAGDPAFKNYAFGFAMGHREDDQYVIDLMHRFYNPHGEIDATEPRSLVDSLKAAGFIIGTFGFDTWQFPETIQHIRSPGIDTVQHTVDLETYSFLKELSYSGRITIYRHEYAIEELKSLELVRGKRVDHRSGYSKDIADAIANVCWLLREPVMEKYDTKILRA